MSYVNVPFCLGLQPFTNKIKKSLQGLSISNHNYKIVAYADDVNVIIADVQDSVRVKSIIKTYEQASNAKLNEEKTNMIFTGSWMANEKAQIDLFNVVEKTKILGVVFTNNV